MQDKTKLLAKATRRFLAASRRLVNAADARRGLLTARAAAQANERYDKALENYSRAWAVVEDIVEEVE